MKRTIVLERVHSGEETTVYDGDDGRKYMLRAVDRDYTGTRKPPAYYLLVGTGSEKPRYVSGLFQTREPGVLSGDLKDDIGVRRMFTLTVSDGGQRARIEPRKASRRGRYSKGGKTGTFSGETPVGASTGQGGGEGDF